MEENLHRLVYYSRNHMAGPPATMASSIDQILEASRRNNAPVGVTGALMFNAGCFAQVLEGPRAVLESTFERIQQDERHGDVSLLGFEEIPARRFSARSMGFVGARADEAAAYGSAAARSGFDPSTASGDEVMRTLIRLALADEDA